MIDETATAVTPPGADSDIPASETRGPRPGAALVVASAPPSPWWRIADFAVFSLWVAIVAFILPYHEKWADEAQAWLIARDLALRTIWFHELRYEGSPGLWHTILWVAQHVFHARYGALCVLARGLGVAVALSILPRLISVRRIYEYFGVGR